MFNFISVFNDDYFLFYFLWCIEYRVRKTDALERAGPLRGFKHDHYVIAIQSITVAPPGGQIP